MKQDLSKCSAYTVKVSKQVQELNGVMSILEHNKTKAKICVIENNDENKVFCVGFRTPPKDSTGIPHILEHSVLCGSRKYPVKEPFVELAKGSLCNFVNAMTYPERRFIQLLRLIYKIIKMQRVFIVMLYSIPTFIPILLFSNKKDGIMKWMIRMN